jgi:hypothetical protein
MADVINFSVKRSGDGLWTGQVVLPVGPPGATRGQSVAVTAKSGDKSSALAKAAGLAEQIALNPIVQAALPPGAGAAVQALKMLGQSGAAEGMKKLVGEGAKRIASALKFW